MRQVQRWVIDSNCLQSPDLASFLAESPDHFAVLTDYTCMEIYKQLLDTAVYERISLLAQYPSQVVMLKGTTEICGFKGRQAGLTRRLIDADQSRGFKLFCEQTKQFASGDDRFRADISRKQLKAREHLARMATDMRGVAVDYAEMEALFSPVEIKSIRSQTGITREAGVKFLKQVRMLTEALYTDHPRAKHRHLPHEWPNTFLFRMSLFRMVHFFDWLRGGSPSNISPERARNDAVDSIVGVYATFFDGLFTNDKKSLRIYGEASMLLEKFILPASRTEVR